MFQITDTRLRAADNRWRRTINRFRSPIPRGLGIAQVVADSNNNVDPVIRTPARLTGLMGIPVLQGQRLGYTQDLMREGETSLYLWSVIFNKNGIQLHNLYPTLWTEPTYDFWLSVRLVFVLGLPTYRALVTEVQKTGAASDTTNITADIQNWITNVMLDTQKIGTQNKLSLTRISNELDDFRRSMQSLDGPDRASSSFGLAPTINPGGDRRAYQVARI